ncbi:MAG: hypothetical protein QXI42_09605 [Thermoproteota archaeon]|nr:hypothetical protein [Candidatus Brockarchaeota archaeon]
MNPELRKRFVDSIDYLRKMGFFQDYSNLSSEEIFEKILRGEIDYSIFWEDGDLSDEEYKRKRDKLKLSSYGAVLIESIKEKEDLWMKTSDASLDYEMACFDTKRVMVQDAETDVIKGAGIGIIKRLTKISRGSFQPIILSEELNEHEENPPQDELWRGRGMWSSFTVRFKYGMKEHTVNIFFHRDYLYDTFVWDINKIIRDTGYQYYAFSEATRDGKLALVALTEEEADRLKKERKWEIYKR